MGKIAKKTPKKLEIKKPDTTETAVISDQLKKQLKNKAERKKKSKKNRPERGVLLIRHLPHGFFEKQLKEYFRQFGKVTRVRLARSTRTGGSKGYAFIEFEIPEVAQVAADSMQNYLMFQKLVKTNYIPPEEQKFNYFSSTVKAVRNSLGKKIYISYITKRRNEGVKRNNTWDENNYRKRTNTVLKKLNKLKKKYSDLDIDFDSIVVKPKLGLKVDAGKKDSNENETNDSKVDIEDVPSDIEETSSSLLLVRKRKGSSSINEKKIAKKPFVKMDPPTLDTDSSEEEHNLVESYGASNSDSDYNSEGSDFDKKEIEKKPSRSITRKVNRLEQIIKKKPLLGGIQKQSKKMNKNQKKLATNRMASTTANDLIKNSKTELKILKKSDLMKSKKGKKRNNV